jgi:hypothetical protein
MATYGSWEAANSPEAAAYYQGQQSQQAHNKGGLGGWLFGNQANPGVTGAGMRAPNAVQVDPNAAQVPGYAEDRARSLGGALAAQQRGAGSMTAAQLAGQQQAQARAGQNSLAQMLMAQAQGQGPSLAQAQLQRATDNNIGAAMAMGQTMGRGTAPGLAMRNIQQNASGLQAQAGADSAALRMQEQMQAQNQLGQVLAGMRGQDIGFAAENAQLQQGANSQNLGALLAQRGLNDQMTMGYERNALGLGALQGGQNMDLARLLAGTGLSNEQLAQGAYDEAARRRMGLLGGGVQAGGQAAGGLGSMLAFLASAPAAASDERVKTNIRRSDIEALPGVPFATWDYLPEFGGRGSFGVIAQDLEAAGFGEYVTRREDGVRLVDYSFLGAPVRASLSSSRGTLGGSRDPR